MSVCCATSAVGPLILTTGVYNMQDVSSKLNAQIEGVKNIPMRVVANWPTFFTFGLVDWVVNSIIFAIPAVDGMGGSVLTGTLRGMRDTFKFVTWGAIGDRAI